MCFKEIDLVLSNRNAITSIGAIVGLLTASNTTLLAFFACSDINMLDCLPLGVSWSLSVTWLCDISSEDEGLSNDWASCVASSNPVIWSLSGLSDDLS